MKLLIKYYLIVNIFAYVLYGADKWKAKNGRWRISEKVLLGLAFLGGGLGALLGMKSFRHKTRKMYFRILVPLFLGCHIILFLLAVYLGR